jgi:anti-sigma regulatory factor (Ser/Thr protein kinase)
VADRLRLEVREPEDVNRARREARRLAVRLGFDAVGAEEVALVATELGTNLVRYAQGGRVLVAEVCEGERRGLEVVSEDDGPGIPDVARAVADGYSSGGGLGGGLGGVHRLASEVSIHTSEQGTRIVARKWLAS